MSSEQKQVNGEPRQDDLTSRLDRLESLCLRIVDLLESNKGESGTETPVAPWQFLVTRQHPWRRQLYVKGRNMTVRQLVGTIKANQLSAEEAAADLDLPVETIQEALAYAESHRELLNFETAYEQLLLAEKGYGRGPKAVSG